MSKDRLHVTNKSSDSWQESACARIWTALVQDLSARSETILPNLIRQFGLKSTIRLADQVSKILVRAEFHLDGETQIEIERGGRVFKMYLKDFIPEFCETVDPAELLLALRFPKRFTPNLHKEQDEKALAAFLTLQNRSKMLSRRCWEDSHLTYTEENGYEWVPGKNKPKSTLSASCSWVVQELQEILRNIFQDYQHIHCFRYNGAVPLEYPFSNGMSLEGKSLAQKLVQFDADCVYGDYRFPLLYHPIRNLELFRKTSDTVQGYTSVKTFKSLFGWDLGHWDGHGARYSDVVASQAALIKAVPKNLEVSRIIGEENVTRNYFGKLIRRQLLRMLKKHFEIGYIADNQEWSKIAAYTGSFQHPGYCTIDLSSASDSECYTMMHTLYSKVPGLNSDVEWTRAQYLMVDGKLVVNHLYLTSGHTLTFVLMSAVLLACAELAEDIHKSLGESGQYLPAIIYGDDVAIDERLFDTFIHIISELGFMVNKDKSFGPGEDYRESCGVEFYRGYEVSSTYWPRRALSAPSGGPNESDLKTLAVLVDLQHRLYDYPKCRLAINKLIREYQRGWKQMLTEVPALSEHNAPWAGLPIPYFERETCYKRPIPQVVPERPVYHVLGSKPGKVPDNLHDGYWHNYLMFKYVEYLSEGPMPHSDPLLKLLGCTESRIRPGDFGGGMSAIITVWT